MGVCLQVAAVGRLVGKLPPHSQMHLATASHHGACNLKHTTTNKVLVENKNPIVAPPVISYR